MLPRGNIPYRGEGVCVVVGCFLSVLALLFLKVRCVCGALSSLLCACVKGAYIEHYQEYMYPPEE